MLRNRASTLPILTAAALGASIVAASAQMPPCANDFLPLRDAVQRDGLKVKAAIDKKDRAEICNQLKRFVTTEAKFVKYMQDNQGWCGIPQEAIEQLKKNHAHSTKLREQACAAGAAAGGPKPIPAGPGLSDALGTSRAPTPGTAQQGRGTFDTLTGSPFKQ